MTTFDITVLPSAGKNFVPKFCRACACKLEKKSCCEIENNPAKPELPLLLKRYVPEFDIKVANAYLCTDCVYILYAFHNFKRKCLRTEENLRLYIRQKREVKIVDINEVFEPVKPRKTTTERLHICEVCRKGFAKKTILNEHMRLKHKERLPHSSQVTCTLCSRSFKYRKSLRGHMEKYHGRERYQCNKCSREFVFKSRYDYHINYHNTVGDSLKYVCEICNYVYPSQNSLDRHIVRRHKSEDQRPFGCTTCGRRFVETNALKVHMLVHTKKKQFKCELCSYVGSREELFIRHLRTKHRVTVIDSENS